MEKSLLQPFAVDQILMRVWLVRSEVATCVVFVCTHALMDGRGMVMFTDKLLFFMDACKRGMEKREKYRERVSRRSIKRESIDREYRVSRESIELRESRKPRKSTKSTKSRKSRESRGLRDRDRRRRLTPHPGAHDEVAPSQLEDVDNEITRSSSEGDAVYSRQYATLPLQARVHCHEREWAVELHRLPTSSQYLPNLLAACKRNLTTVTAALTSAFTFIIHQERANEEEEIPVFHISTPVDARPFANTKLQDADIQNNFVLSTVEVEVGEKDTFWDIAKQYQTILTKKLKNKEWMDTSVPGWMFVRADIIEDDADLFESQARNNSFTISNIGDINRQLAMEEAWKYGEFSVIDVSKEERGRERGAGGGRKKKEEREERGEWKGEEGRGRNRQGGDTIFDSSHMCATVSQQLIGAPLFIVVLTLNGCIYLSVGFPTPTYSREYIRCLCEKVSVLIGSNIVV